MEKNRLEAFSDGVFAIAITLLILDIRIPAVKYDRLPQALISVLPSIASYVLSFMVIGLYWAFHHFYVDKLKKIDGTIMFLNLLTLLLVSFMPFPTSLMGTYPFTPIPVLIYGCCLLSSNLVGMATVYYIHKHPQLYNEKFPPGFFRSQFPMYVWVNIPYIIACCLAFRYPVISYWIFILVLLGVSLSLWNHMKGQRSQEGR